MIVYSGAQSAGWKDEVQTHRPIHFDHLRQPFVLKLVAKNRHPLYLFVIRLLAEVLLDS